MMDIVKRINRLLQDDVGATTTGNVATNTAKGHIDVIGGECPAGQKYDPKKKVCVPIKNESRETEIKSWQKEFRSMGLKFHPKWEDFVKKNWNTIKAEEKKIRKFMADIKDPKSQKKYFKREMGDLMSKLTNLWGSMKESSVVGGSYIGGTTVNIVGSGQTRVVGDKQGSMIDLDRKNIEDILSADKTKQNLGRKGLRFNNILGAYVPDHWKE